MKVGEKIRGLRTLKGLSQENMAHELGLSLTAYGDIERDQKSVSIDRLEKIAEILQVSVTDILTFGEKIANFFDQCNVSSVAAAQNGVTNVQNNYDAREVQHELEKARLEIEKLKMQIAKLEAEKAKAELEAAYWREKAEK